MSNIRLDNITKIYSSKKVDTITLKNISIQFKGTGITSILGPSGCGKTSLLNILGGLDTPENGTILVDGVSTNLFKERQWDSYRNQYIGFVFQEYNLIEHLTVFDNVAMSLNLSGESKRNIYNKTMVTLEKVGISELAFKYPVELSGGQKQKTSIARAIINNPKILLADEPTGALDSKSSLAIMALLKKISEEILIILVTHNRDLAKSFSNRIIEMNDGKILSDNSLSSTKESSDKFVLKMTNLSYFKALKLSFKNLLTKKIRTLITAVAGSIGIIGISLVLALSSGFNTYIQEIQISSLTGLPIAISPTPLNVGMTVSSSTVDKQKKYPNKDTIYSRTAQDSFSTHHNEIGDNYIGYLDKLGVDLEYDVAAITKSYGTNINALRNNEENIEKINLSPYNSNTLNLYWQELPDNSSYILENYELLGTDSHLPTNDNEVALIITDQNEISEIILDQIGISEEEFDIDQIIGKELCSIVHNDDYYEQQGEIFIDANPNEYSELYYSKNSKRLTISAVLQVREEGGSAFLNEGIGYAASLNDFINFSSSNSQIAEHQRNSNYNVLTNKPFSDTTEKDIAFMQIGSNISVTGIKIYPINHESRTSIRTYLDNYNSDKNSDDKIIYDDVAESAADSLNNTLGTISSVLVSFSSIALIVSSIMIAIITYISVLERKREIGILRSIGARRKDIYRIFSTESIIIGTISGIVGITFSILLVILINNVASTSLDIENLCKISLLTCTTLLLFSVLVSFISGIIPSRIASKQKPIDCIKTF